jgi:type III restriction enzyme
VRCDWWLFSRTDETTDKVILPYYDPQQNRIRDFHPDFVFWLVRGDEYTILLVDPKGMMASSYQHKIEDYRRLFRTDDGGYRIFTHGRFRVRVALALYNKEASAAPAPYRAYWHDHVRGMLDGVMTPFAASG